MPRNAGDYVKSWGAALIRGAASNPEFTVLTIMLLRQCIRIKGVTHAVCTHHELYIHAHLFIMPWKGHPSQSIRPSKCFTLHAPGRPVHNAMEGPSPVSPSDHSKCFTLHAPGRPVHNAMEGPSPVSPSDHSKCFTLHAPGRPVHNAMEGPSPVSPSDHSKCFTLHPLADLFIMPWKGHPQSVHQTAQRALHFTPWQTCS